MACGLDPFWRPDVVHAHDWHAGLAPAYLAARGHPAKSVFTVHNLAYQGMFYAKHMDDIQLPWSFFNVHGLEFNNGVPVGPGRGSGAGSLVAYALKITDLDPLEFDLLFDNLVTFLHTEVNVEVRHGDTFRVKETFEQQSPATGEARAR